MLLKVRGKGLLTAVVTRPMEQNGMGYLSALKENGLLAKLTVISFVLPLR